MNDHLTGTVVLPPATTPTKALVLLHGFGANGDDLAALAPLLQQYLPDLAVFAPNGPLESGYGEGYAWFSDNGWTFVDRPGIGTAHELLQDYLEQEVLGAAGISLQNTVVAGFSQGAMTALFSVPRLPMPVAGLVSMAGAMMWQDELVSEPFHTCPVLVLHNRDDDVVQVQAAEEIADQLAELGFDDVDLHIFPRGGHSINEQGLAELLGFLQRVLV